MRILFLIFDRRYSTTLHIRKIQDFNNKMPFLKLQYHFHSADHQQTFPNQMAIFKLDRTTKITAKHSPVSPITYQRYIEHNLNGTIQNLQSNFRGGVVASAIYAAIKWPVGNVPSVKSDIQLTRTLLLLASDGSGRNFCGTSCGNRSTSIPDMDHICPISLGTLAIHEICR